MYVVKDNEVLKYKEFENGRKEYSEGKPLEYVEILPREIKANIETNIFIRHMIFSEQQQEYILNGEVNKKISVDGTEIDVVNGLGYFALESPNQGEKEYVLIDGEGVAFDVT